MSCEKIKLHLPHLCRPDEDCKKIGNPLSYYNRKNWILSKERTESEDNVGKEDYNEEKEKEDQANGWIEVKKDDA